MRILKTSGRARIPAPTIAVTLWLAASHLFGFFLHPTGTHSLLPWSIFTSTPSFCNFYIYTGFKIIVKHLIWPSKIIPSSIQMNIYKLYRLRSTTCKTVGHHVLGWWKNPHIYHISKFTYFSVTQNNFIDMSHVHPNVCNVTLSHLLISHVPPCGHISLAYIMGF